MEKTTGTSHTQKVYALGKMLALMNGQSLSKAWVPLPGGAAAVYNPSISRYLVPDWQGSYRIGSTTTRTYGFSVAFGPFGERYSLSGSPSDFTFAGNNNDTVTNEYDAVNRKEHSSQGRWISPDPVVGNLGDPQSFNKYAYVRNSPLTLVDPSGLAQTGETVKSYLLDDLADLPDAPSATEQGKHNLQDFQNLQMGGPGVSVAANFSFNASNPWGQSSFTGQWVGYGMAQAFGAGSGLRNGDVPADAKAQVVFQGNRQLWNSAATWGNAAFAATGAAIAAPFAAPAIASTGGAILNRLAFGASAGRVFYSGYGAWATASTAAGTYGLSVIETTPVGRLLGLIENAGTSLGLEAQEIGTMLDPIWKSASGLYAGGASGPVLAYQSWSLSAISTWGTVEYGALANNGASIIYLSTGW